jgi:hypothetical protein
LRYLQGVLSDDAVARTRAEAVRIANGLSLSGLQQIAMSTEAAAKVAPHEDVRLELAIMAFIYRAEIENREADHEATSPEPPA